MTQLDIFHQGSERDSATTSRTSTPVEADRATLQETLPPTASRSGQQSDHAGQLGDDGSLHWMLTGLPEPPRFACHIDESAGMRGEAAA